MRTMVLFARTAPAAATHRNVARARSCAACCAALLILILVAPPAVATSTVRLVKDIVRGAGGSAVRTTFAIDGTLYFAANDRVHGFELWKSDGTRAGTVLLKDIFKGPEGSAPSQFTDVGGTLFFTAYDGNRGLELWKSDGTRAGIVMVKESGRDRADPGPAISRRPEAICTSRLTTARTGPSSGRATEPSQGP